MFLATSLCGAILFTISSLLLVAVLIQLLLPRLLSSAFNNYATNVGSWQISISLAQPIRICFFSDRMIRIDVSGAHLLVRKQADIIRARKKNVGTSSNQRLICQALFSLIAVRFHKISLEICLASSVSVNVKIPFVSVSGAIQSTSQVQCFIEMHSILVHARQCDQRLLSIKQDALAFTLDYDIVNRKLSGISIKSDRISLQSELDHLIRLKQLRLSSQSSPKSVAPVILPDQIHFWLKSVQFFVNDFQLNFSHVHIWAQTHDRPFGSLIESQLAARTCELRQLDRPLLNLKSMTFHSGQGYRLDPSVTSFMDEIQLTVNGLSLSVQLGDLHALVEFRNMIQQQDTDTPTDDESPPKIFSIPFGFVLHLRDSEFNIERSLIKVTEVKSILSAPIELQDKDRRRRITVDMLHLIAYFNQQPEPIAHLTSVRTLTEFLLQDGVRSRQFNLHLHHAEFNAPVLVINQGRDFLQRYSKSDSSQAVARWRTSFTFSGHDMSILLSLDEPASDVLRASRVHIGSCRLIRDDRWRSMMFEHCCISTTAMTNHISVVPQHEFSHKVDHLFLSQVDYSEGGPARIQTVELNWSVSFHTTLVMITGALQTTTSSPSSAKASPIAFTIQSSSFLFNIDKSVIIAINADQVNYVRDLNSSITLGTESSAVAVNGCEFLSWSKMVYLHQSHDPYPDIDLEFANLTVFIAESVSIGFIIETIRRKWRALKLWRRSPLLAPAPIKVSTLEYRCICLRIDIMSVVFEENVLERAQLYRRWISLNPAGRRRHRRAWGRYQESKWRNTDSEDDSRIQSLRRSSILKTSSDSVPHESRDSDFELNPNLDPLDDPFMDRFDQLQLLATDRIQWALAVLQIGQLCLSLSPEHGNTSPNAAVSSMASLDSESNPPYDRAGSGQEFAEIWAKKLQFSCNDTILKLRDYPFALVAFSELSAKGHLICACLKSPELFRHRKLVVLPLAHNRICFAPVDLPDGSSVPNKFFIEIQMESSRFELNYGQCQRGALAAFSKAVGKITDTGWSTTSRSQQSLGWWDQLRYKIHGRINFNFKQFTLRVLTSVNPYHDEFIRIGAEKLSLESDKGRFSISARHFQIHLDEGTVSRSTLCRPGLLVACPYVRILLLFNWGCKSRDPSQHYVHHVQWQSQEYQFSSMMDRDLYDDFRARSVSMKIKLHFLAMDSGSGAAPITGPLISFWFKNVSWFQQINALYTNPPNVCTVIPKVLIGPNRAIVPVKSGNSFSSLISQIKLQISLSSTLFELIAEPEKERISSAINENDILGIQGFSQLLQFGADLDVVSERVTTNSGHVTRRKWVWSKQRARSLHSSIDLLLPILSTVRSCNPDDDHLKERLAHPLSQTPFATGEGDSGSMFFMSADNLSYCSPSAGGKLAVFDLTGFNDPLLNLQSSPVSSNEPQSSAQTSSSLPLSSEEISVQEFLHSHFGELDLGPFDEDNRVQVLSFSALSDAEIEHDFDEFSDREDAQNNREHYVLVSGLRVLWNNSIRASFNAWWSFMSSFGHSESSSAAGTDSTAGTCGAPADQAGNKGVKRYATWSGNSDQTTRISASLSRPDQTVRRLTSFELFQRLEQRETHPEHDEELLPREATTPVVLTDDDCTASLKSHNDDETGRTRFAMLLEQPQVILQSVEVGCSVVISAHQAKVDVIAFPYYFSDDAASLKGSPFHTRSPVKPFLERKSSSYFSNCSQGGPGLRRPVKQNFIYFKKTIRSRLDQAQLHVVPNNIDVDSNAMEWIPLEDFPTGKSCHQSFSQEQDIVLEETASSADHLYQTRYLKSNGIFQRISQPTSLVFDYSYDVNMDTKDLGALEHQFLHRSTEAESIPNDDIDPDDSDSVPIQPFEAQDLSLPMLTSSSRLFINKINFVMDSLQCKVLISVIDKLVLSPVQHIWAAARALQATRRATADPSSLDPKELQKCSAEALGSQQSQIENKVFRRCISYEILGATWTLITKSPDVFLHVQLRRLHGLHRYRIDEGRDIEFGLKEFRIRNLATNALWPDVVAPHHRWDVAKGSTELMLRVRAQVVGWSLPYARRLRDVTAWDHFDIKVFPLIIKVQSQHYSCTRDYFFPGKEPAPTESTNRLLSQSHVVMPSSLSSESLPQVYTPYTNRQRKAVMTLRKPFMAINRLTESSSIVTPKSTSAADPVPIVNYNYFKYFHISDLEFHIYFRGSFIDLDDLHVIISAFSCNGELWTWDKLVSKIETHVQTSVLKQSKSLIKQKFSSSVKSLAEKEHKIRDRFTAKFARKQKEDDSNPK